MLVKLNKLIKNVKEAYENYEFASMFIIQLITSVQLI